MEAGNLNKGDIVQIDPQHDDVFCGCLMIVTEPKSWGAQGYVQVPQKGNAYYRCKFENMEYCGRATWIHEIPEDDDGTKT